MESNTPSSRTLPVLLSAGLLLSGCATLQRQAARGVTDLLAGDAVARVFLSENDPELVRASLPFALKTNEILLENDPHNPALRLSLARGYAAYACAFLDTEAQRLRETDYERSRALQTRAERLYLRARDHAKHALEQRHPGLFAALRTEPESALNRLVPNDADLVYWAAASWAAAIRNAPQRMDRLAELPIAGAMMRRLLVLDPTYDQGAVHEFFIRFEGARSPAMGGSPERARHHFDEAVRLSRGRRLSPYLALAETVAIQEQDVALFRGLLRQALSFDIEQAPEERLLNTLHQETAQWLLAREDHYFLLDEEIEP